MTSVGPPDIPAEESHATRDLNPVTPSSNVEDLVDIHWTVDFGEELTVDDVANYMDAFKKVVYTGEWLALMAAQDNKLTEVSAGQTVVRKLSYGSPWSIILSAPEQLAKGIVCLLEFVINVPANVKERWAKAGEAKTRAALLKHLKDEIEAGHIRLTQDQVFQLLLSADHKALQILATSGQLVTYGRVNRRTGAAHWRM